MGARDELRAALEKLSELPVGKPPAAEVTDSWQLDENRWESIDCKEDLAVAPELEWPDDVKRLALAAYNETFAKFLEEGKYYVLVWPPSGNLEDGGDWGYPRLEECDEHGDERDPECQSCRDFEVALNDGEPTMYEPAEWSWTLNVETWRLAESPDGQRRPVRVIDDEDEEDTWYLGRTTMPPWAIWYAERMSW